MRSIWLSRILSVAALLILQASFISSMEAEPSAFNDPNFQIVWERTDKPVEMFVTARSYMWGPNTLLNSPSTEPYANSPGGMRTVQYFDKSRMEVNNPGGDRSQLWFVTNGLLVREMVSGLLQLGDTSFQSRFPSLEAVAGDPAPVNPNSPTYATFKNIASLNVDNPSPNRVGQPVVESINISGTISTITSPDPSVGYVSFDPNLKHNIPNKFNEFLNQMGPVFVNGSIVQDVVINSVFLAGLPITEAYWVKAKVAGVEKDVLVQLYERRALTYTPSNPSGFQVEMGNVGQHYLRWRYGKGEERIVFQSTAAAGKNQIYSMKTDGSNLKQLTTLGENREPRWSPDNSKIAFSSTRDGNFEIYVMNADGSNQTRLTNTADAEELPDWSADGSRLFFTRGNAGNADIWSMAADGSDQKNLTNTATFIESVPRASSDGQKVAFGTNRDGQVEVYSMNVDGSNPARLTNRAGTNDFPTDWKDNNILFESFVAPGGPGQIWVMDGAGGGQAKISGDFDREAVFSPDLLRIALNREVAAVQNVYAMNADGSNAQNLTNTNDVFYRWPDWSN